MGVKIKELLQAPDNYINQPSQSIIMAKPIMPTPTLRGKDAERFVRNMIKEQKSPDPRRIAVIKRALSRKFVVVR